MPRLSPVWSALLLTMLPVCAYAQDRTPEFAQALHLRPNQQAAYVAYLDATKPDPSAEARREAELRRLAGLTTPERIDWTRRQMQDDLRTLDQQGAAVKRFYQALSPEQRRTFDDLTRPPAP